MRFLPVMNIQSKTTFSKAELGSNTDAHTDMKHLAVLYKVNIKQTDLMFDVMGCSGHTEEFKEISLSWETSRNVTNYADYVQAGITRLITETTELSLVHIEIYSSWKTSEIIHKSQGIYRDVACLFQ